MSINRCDICYHYVGEACQGTYEIPTGLSAGTYTLVLEDQNGNVYMDTAAVAGAGSGHPVTITVSDYPDGMFNQWSGSYEIYFTDGGFDGTQKTLSIAGKEYPCILMTFKDVTVI